MFHEDLIERFRQERTPFYYYDLSILDATLEAIQREVAGHPFKVHYAIKANANSPILECVKQAGFGIDCVSGNEIQCALDHGFASQDIAFAGVGKTDEEILLALRAGIFTLNVESLAELKVINELAESEGGVAPVALRFNPNVNANTHHYITTGLEENKFGINHWELSALFELIRELKHIEVLGLHFHIGSQILDLSVYKNLCNRVNEYQALFEKRGIDLHHINVGGGLGVDYTNPDKEAIPDFKAFFDVFKEFLSLKPNQALHFELGRSIVGQCGSLISKVLYIKHGVKTNFAILDAGMTELIRPALYQAVHHIENITPASKEQMEKYDVVGPICESSDCFGKSVDLPETKRGDLIAIRSAGAYGEVMTSHYNLRDKVQAIYDK